MIVSNKKIVETVLKYHFPDRLTRQLWVGKELVHTHIFNHKGEGKYLYQGWEDRKEAYISFESFLEDDNESWVAEFDNDIIELLVYNKDARVYKKYTEKDEIEIENYLRSSSSYQLFTSKEELDSYIESERLLSLSEIRILLEEEIKDEQHLTPFINNFVNQLRSKICQQTKK